MEGKGVSCIKEVSRRVIIKEQETGSDGMPWANMQRFSRLVYDNTISQLANSDALICDRSLLDLEAYLKIENQPIPEYLKTYSYHKTYHKTVFFAPTWFDIYCKDGQRLQEFDYCLKLEKALLKAYQLKGFNLVKLPCVSPSKRAEYLIEYIR